MKLNQVVAIIKGEKDRYQKTLTALYHQLQKATGSFDGRVKRYSPAEEEGETFPDDVQHVKVRVDEVLAAVSKGFAEFVDLVATQDVGNTQAAADIVVEGAVLAQKVPVTHLLFLEHKIVDLRTVIDQLPTLDVAYQWKLDPAQNLYSTSPERTVKSKKVTQHKIIVQPTDKHPAQVAEYTEDVIQGYWNTTLYSGRISVQTKQAMLERADKLLKAIKFAREEANNLAITKSEIAKPLIGYVLGT